MEGFPQTTGHSSMVWRLCGALRGWVEVKVHEGVGPGSRTVCSSATHEAAQLWELHREAPRDKALPLTCAPTHGITDPSPELCSISLPSPGLSPPQGLPVSSAFFLFLLLWLVPTFCVPISWVGAGAVCPGGPRVCFAPLYFTWT